MAGPEELALSCPYNGTAQGTFGSFAFGAIRAYARHLA